MKATRIALALGLGGAVLALPAPARAAGLGGYTLAASATPVAVQVFEPTLPIPAEPQLELDVAYSRSKLSSGPVGQALASLAWPGDGVGYGLPTLLKNPDATYPVKVEASAPGGPADAKQEPVPGTGMSTHAGSDTVEAAAYLAKPTTPALPTLPLPGITVPTALLSMESVSTHSVASAGGDKATASAYATVGSVSLLGGIVKLDGLRVDTTAASDGSQGTGTGSVTWTSMTLAGQTIGLNQDGAASPLGVTALPKLPAAVSSALADLGVSLAVPVVNRSGSGTGAAVTGQGLTVTLDTGVLRGKLNLSALLDPVLSLLPADVLTQVRPWLGLGPKLVFILGTATSQANATAAAGDTSPPTGGGAAPGGGSGGATGGGSSGTGSTGDALPPMSGAPVPVAEIHQWPAFPGVPWYLYGGGLVLAGGVAYGLRRYAALLFGAGGCDLGASAGVPDLRRR